MKTYIGFATAFLLVGCSVGYDGPGPGPAWTFSDNPPITSLQLTGTWAGSNCIVDVTSSSIMQMHFSSVGQAEIVAQIFPNLGCTGAPAADFTMSGTYALGDLDAVVPGATDLALNFGPTIQVSPDSTAGAVGLNTIALCGLATWQVGTTEAMLPSANCLSVLSEAMQGQTIAVIMDDALYFGNGNNTHIDTNVPFQYSGAP